MKKIFALLLAVLYVTASSGVVLNVHYCMGKVSSVKVDNFSDTFCKCGMKKTSSSCCQSELKVVKISDDQNSTVVPSTPATPVFILSPIVSLLINNETTRYITEEPIVNGPPLLASNKIYIVNGVFRI